ncbi:hypothetical protein DAEQUDRAFT_284947 [Daedalea quercina L-15889]|uniref:Uncharacterized protein n=1 Tax=Daedalea quercina L-15889 TaxID=1314783 RepID=A0A165TVE3_9APHY|nr:hypothetical protein DAEQUDRAFT_284947 [Daedalea quercina L-15889]
MRDGRCRTEQRPRSEKERETHVITREGRFQPAKLPGPSSVATVGHGPPGRCSQAPLFLYNLPPPPLLFLHPSDSLIRRGPSPIYTKALRDHSPPPSSLNRPRPLLLALPRPRRATTMSTRTAFTSFDPLATHPFTNNSGLLPKPAAPSQFPHPIPAPLKADAATVLVPSTPHSIRAPQPRKAPSPSKSSAHSTSGGPKPIFVPFRPERSSPELDDILLKKKVSDVFANKNTWSIDQFEIAPGTSVNARR